MTQSLPKHSKIFNYWKDKAITYMGEVKKLEEVSNKEEFIVVVSDWGEPECWGCGSFISKIYDYKTYEQLLDKNYEKTWDYSCVKNKLERAHIIPKLLSNNNDVSNLFLLCKKCHYESPDYMDSSFFYRFIYEARKSHINGWTFRDLEKIAELVNLYGGNIKDFDVSKIDDSKIGTHGFKAVSVTLISAVVDATINNQ